MGLSACARADDIGATRASRVTDGTERIDPRLLALPNVVLTPHMGSAMYEGRVASDDKVIRNIRAWPDGHRPLDQVL